jgi:hypothetical protein
MNDLGRLATDIVNYEFSEDRQRFPVSYVSGWLDANIGELNGLLNEEFYINSTGAIELEVGSGLLPVEENIYSTMYEIHYYEKASRDALRGFVYNAEDDWLTLKEGDTTIQRQNKNSVAKTFFELKESTEKKLNDLVGKYNVYKSNPSQVAGLDGAGPIDSYDGYSSRSYYRGF